MEKFNWEICKNTRNSSVYDYLIGNYDKPISKEKYIKEMGSIQRIAHSKELDKRNYLSRKSRWSKSTLRYQYRKLKENFGFFPV